jgi:hypothetical protein
VKLRTEIKTYTFKNQTTIYACLAVFKNQKKIRFKKKENILTMYKTILCKYRRPLEKKGICI